MSEESQNDITLRQAFSFQNTLTGYAYLITKNWPLAQDAFQEAIIALHHQLDKLDHSNVYNWLKRVTHNKAVDLVRKNQRLSNAQAKLTELVAAQAESEMNESDVCQTELETKALYECMQGLRGDARQLIVDFYHNNTPCTQLSHSYNKSENALRLILSRTRKSLKTCIQQKLKALETA